MSNTNQAAIGYIGKVKVRTLSSVNNPVQVEERVVDLTNKGTALLFKSLVNYLVEGTLINPDVPLYLRIMNSNSTEPYINHPIMLTKRSVVEDNYYALCSCALSYSNLIPGHSGEQVKLQLTTGNSSTAPNIVLAETTYTLPSTENFTQNQSLLIEWRLGFISLEPSSGGD